MLVLTRKCQEKIQIGDNITITIVRVKGQSVRVGIEAPRELKVLRTELPPESPVDGASASEDQPAETFDDEQDSRTDYRPAKQPLAQYIPGSRLLAVTCAG